MFCRKCGSQLAENVSVCDSCNTRIKPAVFCHRCAAELPPNSTRCMVCNAKSRAHKSAVHWLPLGLTLLAFIFYAFGGYYHYDYVLGVRVYNYDMPYTTVLCYLAIIAAAVALLISVFVIPKTRVVLKVINILLSGIMLFLAVMWVVDALMM